MGYRTYKYRIYPTMEQSVLINKTIGSARFVYNMLLADCMKQYKENGRSSIKSPAYLKKDFEWLKEVDSLALCNAQMSLNSAYRKFFSKQNKFPKFHTKKSSSQSYTTNCIKNSIRIEHNGLKLPKLGYVKTVFHRFCRGTIKSANISRTKTGKYFVSILTEYDKPAITESKMHNADIGIDMSFHGDFAVYSDGTKTNFPNWYLKSLDNLAYLNRKFAKTKKDSCSHRKLHMRIARVYEKCPNQMKDWQEKESLRIASNFDIVSVEDINMQNMARMNHGKKVLNNGFGAFRTMLERKTKEHLGTFVKADKWFPSSQICHICGYRNTVTKDLSVYDYICPECGTHHNRDVNASMNIKMYGEIASASEVLTPIKSACGGCCKTCKKTHCVLVQAGSSDAGKVAV